MMFKLLWQVLFTKRTKHQKFWILLLFFVSPMAALQQVYDFLGIQGSPQVTAEVQSKVQKVKEVVARTVSQVINRSGTQPAPGQPGGTQSSGTQTGPIRVYFTKPGTPSDANDIAHAVVNYINQTRSTLDVAAFELDNKIIVEALVNAAKRGVRIRLVTETDYLEASGVAALKAAGVPVVDDQRPGALMHDKFMVFDNRAVWTGSMNFTENCAYRNNNNGMYIDCAELATNYTTKFAWMFEQHKFGGAPSRTVHIPYPALKLADGTIIENYFSTHDHIASRVVERIGQSRESIHFLAFSYTHAGIGDAMLSRAQAGVPVLGVFEKQQTTGGHSQYERMKALGGIVQVYLDGNPRNMHHKVIVLDGISTVAGSFNFSESADKSNDENVVIIHNKDIARQFEEEFQRVYQQAGGGKVAAR